MNFRRSISRPGPLGLVLLGCLALAGTPPSARAQATATLTTLYGFFNGGDGAYPADSLVQGSDGNFYGTANSGNSNNGFGTVFRVTPAGELTTLHIFGGGSDGAIPTSGLAQGNDGNFYGTTSSKGSGGYGTVFKVTPAGVFTTLHAFTGGADGRTAGRLLRGSDGNFYATTYGEISKSLDNGTVFKITPAGF